MKIKNFPVLKVAWFWHAISKEVPFNHCIIIGLLVAQAPCITCSRQSNPTITNQPRPTVPLLAPMLQPHPLATRLALMLHLRHLIIHPLAPMFHLLLLTTLPLAQMLHLLHLTTRPLAPMLHLLHLTTLP